MSLASFIHLVGSFPADAVEEAMQMMCHNLPAQLCRIPDGEPGERSKFVLWQLQKVWPKDVIAPMSINNGQTPGLGENKIELTMDRLPSTTGYAEAAISSYQAFRQMRDAGTIPQGVRFQVCLPSPTTVVGLELHPEYQLAGEQLYEKLLHADLKTIQDAIPHHDLAIQFDILAEVCFMEHAYGPKGNREPAEWFFNQLRPYFEPVREGIASRIARLTLPVHPDVELGIHLCYGDAGRKHIIEPVNAAILVELINVCVKSVSHRIAWIHMPVPKSRTDEEYFAPLSSLTASETSIDLEGTALVLGLAHAHDDKGTTERLSAARRALPGVKFGISTECGLGRVPKEDLPSLFQILKDHSETH